MIKECNPHLKTYDQIEAELVLAREFSDKLYDIARDVYSVLLRPDTIHADERDALLARIKALL